MAKQSVNTDQEQRPHLYKPGQSGNPKGRPKGSRNKLGEAFLSDMLEDWEEYGKSVIESVRAEKPDVYMKVVASILPRDLNVNMNPLEDADDAELIQRLRELESVLRPFLGDQGDVADSGGTRQAKAH